jgi:hypothetical protein
MATDEILSINFVNANAKKPKIEEIRDENNKIIQTTEISDDNLIVITKTNITGL